MSAGSRIVSVRIPEDLLRRIQAQIRQRNRVSPEQPWVLGEFLRQASEEKLAKMVRSRARRPGKKPPAV
jgi:hypothetical protein